MNSNSEQIKACDSGQIFKSELKKQSDFFRSIYNGAIAYPTQITFTNSKVTKVDSGIEGIIGWNKEDLLHKSIIDLPFNLSFSPDELFASGLPSQLLQQSLRLKNSTFDTFDCLYVGTDINGNFDIFLRQANTNKSESQVANLNYKELYLLLRSIGDNMPDLLWAKNTNKEYIFANKAVCDKLLNATDTTEPVGKTDMYFAERERAQHPENDKWHTFGEICKDSDDVVIKSRKASQFDEYGNVKGKFMFLDVHKAPLYDNQGSFIGTVGCGRDVTLERAIQQRLLETEEKFRKFFDNLNINTAIYRRLEDGSDYIIESVNKKAEKAAHLSKDDLIGQSAIELFPFIKECGLIDTFEKVFITGEAEKIPLKLYENNKISAYTETSVFRLDTGHLVAMYEDTSKAFFAQKALKESEARLIESQKIASIGSWEWDVLNNSIYWTEQMYVLLGVDSKIPASKELFSSCLHPDEVEKYQNNIKKAFKGEQLGHILGRIIRKDNKETRFISAVAKCYYQNNKLVKMAGTMQDITDEHLQKTALKLSEDKLKYIFENTGAGLCLTDDTGKILTSNQAFKSILQDYCSEGQVLNFGSFIHPDDLKKQDTFMQEIAENKRTSYTLEERLIAKDKNQKWVNLNVSVIKNDDNTIKNTICTIEDISDRKLAEKSLKDFERVFNLSVNPICIARIDGTFINVNPAFTNILGYEADELIGKKIFDFIYPEDIEPTVKRIESEIAKGNNIIKLENRYVKKGGGFVWFSWTSQAIYEEGISFSIAHDISNIKQYENELTVAKEKAEESGMLKSAFLANMSHEIRTPMNGIMGFSELLSKDNLDKKRQQKYIKIIQSSGESLLRIINDILDISKIEVGQLEIVEENVNIKQLLTNTHELYINRLKTIQKSNVKFSLKNAPNVTIKSDETRIKQILVNLIDNAIKFTPKGEIKIGCEVNNNRLRFYVSDTGAGISKEDQNVIFDRFRKLSKHDEGNKSGAGLGLAITKNLVEILNGSIWCTSEIGKGTTFYFTVPLHAAQQEIKSCPELGKIELSDLKVLVVEDDETSIMYIEEVFERINVTFDKCYSGKKALQQIKKTSYDLILLDIGLPDMSGLEVAKQVRKINKNAYIIAQTAFAMSNDKETCLKVGCNDYISKPIDQNLLLSKLNIRFAKY